MLVLKRRDGERVRIGENIWVTVCRCHSGRASLKIDAPPEVQVVRGELVGTPAKSAAGPKPSTPPNILRIRGRECA